MKSPLARPQQALLWSRDRMLGRAQVRFFKVVSCMRAQINSKPTHEWEALSETGEIQSRGSRLLPTVSSHLCDATCPTFSSEGFPPLPFPSSPRALAQNLILPSPSLANRKIQSIASVLRLSDVVSLAATRLYTLAVEHKFTKGRKSLNVVAVCLYVACRQKETRNYMLIDFSDLLQVKPHLAMRL
jgi:Transcription factor TFIIB repeat